MQTRVGCGDRVDVEQLGSLGLSCGGKNVAGRAGGQRTWGWLARPPPDPLQEERVGDIR